MPVLVKAIADEKLIGAGVYDLDPNIPLLASQAGALLGRSKTRMDGDRRDGKPPTSYLDGRKVLYPLGAVLAERSRQQGITPEQARAAASDRVRKGGWTFAGFMAQSDQDATWPFAMVRGCPVDYFTSIGMDLGDEDLDDIEELTQEQFLRQRLLQLERERTQAQTTELQANTAMPKPNRVQCRRCGQPAHAGDCRL